MRSAAGPLAGVRVEWRTMVGTGSFRPGSVTLTDAAGEARVHFTPSTDGARVDASIAGTSHQRSLASFPIPIAVYGDEGHTVSFYPGGTMALRVAGLILGGGYTRTDSLVSLGFGFNLAATGLLRGDSLLVDYDFLTEDWGLADGAFALDPSRSTSDW